LRLEVDEHCADTGTPPVLPNRAEANNSGGGVAKPERIPSGEAALAALVLTHAGWNQGLGLPMLDYEPLIAVFEEDNPRFWRELKSRNVKTLIALARAEKARHWSDDQRIILVCGLTSMNTVRVEWCYPENYDAAMDKLQRELKDPGSISQRFGLRLRAASMMKV
jgi:hypothetical protein